jgi:hypothetical protein
MAAASVGPKRADSTTPAERQVPRVPVRYLRYPHVTVRMYVPKSRSVTHYRYLNLVALHVPYQYGIIPRYGTVQFSLCIGTVL